MVVWPGRTFLCGMIDLLSCFRNDSHPIRLNVEFGKDLAWWVEFFGQWNGISFFLFPTLEPLPDFSVSSDASGAIGYGPFMDNEWFNGRWSTLQLPLSVTYKELFLVVLAAHVWGLVGPAGALCFTLTMKLSFTFLIQGRLQTQTLCTCA